MRYKFLVVPFAGRVIPPIYIYTRKTHYSDQFVLWFFLDDHRFNNWWIRRFNIDIIIFSTVLFSQRKLYCIYWTKVWRIRGQTNIIFFLFLLVKFQLIVCRSLHSFNYTVSEYTLESVVIWTTWSSFIFSKSGVPIFCSNILWNTRI